MTTDRDFERTARAWLAYGPDELPERVVDAVADQIHHTRQRHGLALPRRFHTMSMPARAAVIAAVGALALVAAIAAIGVGSRSGPVPSTGPSPATIPTTAPSPAVLLPALDTTFTSARNGFSVKVPAGWQGALATAAWAPGTQTLWGDPALDEIMGPSLSSPRSLPDIRFVGTQQPYADGQTADDWLHAYCRQDPANDCSNVPGSWERITINATDAYLDLDGVPASLGTIVPGGKIYDVVVPLQDRAYAFTMDGVLDRAAVDAFLATIVLRPGNVVELPVLSSTFSSPTYGYTIKTNPAWTVTPAKERWVGIDDSPPAVDEIAFTGTDSGLVGASQALPDGTTYDAWLKAFHEPALTNNPAGCDGGEPSSWPPIQIGRYNGRLDMYCNAAQAVVEVDGRVYVFGWGNATFETDRHLTIESWMELLKTVTFDPAPATP